MMTARKKTHTDLVMGKLFRISRIIGTFPFDESFVISWKRLLYSFCIMSFLSTTCFFVFLRGTHLRRVVKIVFTCFTNLLSLAVLTVNSRYVRTLYQTIQKIENQLVTAGTPWKWTPKNSRMYLGYVGFFVMLSYSALTSSRASGLFWTLSLLFSYVSTFPLALSVMNQFTSIQDILSSLWDEISNSENPNMASAVNLSLAGDTLRSIYGIQILFYTGATFVFVVCNVFYELILYHQEDSSTCFNHIVWIFIILYPLVDIIASSNRTVSKARKFNDTLYEKMIEDQSDSLIKNELVDFHVTTCKDLEFSACGFFTLDNSLLCSMMACATTYLVILLQYTYTPSATVPTNANITISNFQKV